ncbi:MFS transporter [Sphingomonas hengshuiensis]|uniref:MFS transporter n=1 Tax=Sphingomonas hengshuiensis TaxID=1609977 RepID=UPI000A3FC884|nr:MFS transporter [Sphingomonas hengshuiensis]
MSIWKRTRGLRWGIIGVVMLGTVVNYLTRNTLGFAAPLMLADLHITEQQYSWVTGAFQAGIMLQPLVGYILDRIGLRTGFAVFATGWGLLTMAHGLVPSWQWLFAVRGALGFAEGTAHTGGLKVVSEWFPARERGMAGGIYNMGASVGAATAPLLVYWASSVWNWRAAFVVAGLLAFLWVALWLAVYRPLASHPRVSDAERDYIRSGQEAHTQASLVRPSVRSILGRRNFWGIALPRFLADPTWGTLTFWLPLYLTSRGFSLGATALSTFLPFLAGELGCLFGPTVVLWLQRHGIGLIDARRWTFTLGAALMTCMIAVPFATNLYLAVALLSLGGFAHQTLSVTCITLASDLFRKDELGTVAGMAGTMANLGVLLFSLAIGGLVAQIGYAPFFIALGLLDLVAAAVLWGVVRPPIDTQGITPVTELPGA